MSGEGLSHAEAVLAGRARGPVVATTKPLSFWGGVDPASGTVIDVHHPLHGRRLTGVVLVMPSSRGSCSGSGVLLDLLLTGRGPAALVFSEPEDVLTLGALVAAELFGVSLPVVRASPEAFEALSAASEIAIDDSAIEAAGWRMPLAPPASGDLALTLEDQALLDGAGGEAARQAMRIIRAVAVNQQATRLVDVAQVHIDGCIYATPANLTFAERMADLGGRVRVPTTLNAISVDRDHWQVQGVPEAFGRPAQHLADAYVRMGCQPTFTCAPYLLATAPAAGDVIAWAESNAVVFANTVLGARTAKHPDFLDLCIALTGRAPLSGVYLDAHRRARLVIDVDLPPGADDAVWPLVGYLAGLRSPDAVPLLRGLAAAQPSRDDLKALCAAFGTTSAAPMLHIDGVTPEASAAAPPDAAVIGLSRADLAGAWQDLNRGPEEVELVAIGSPHASLSECRAVAEAFGGQPRAAAVAVMLTTGRRVIEDARADGTLAALDAAGVRVLPDLCWCSISEPVFPGRTRALVTNSAKYAHYAPGLSGRAVRFGSLADCVAAAVTGRLPKRLPGWLRPTDAPPPPPLRDGRPAT
jgi:cis-L-3-hydroxyproline dehydratase